MPPVILWLAGAAGAALVVNWLIKEARRVNAELDAVRRGARAEAPADRRNLKRDPETGVFRPH
jgi:hypothetical protein